MVEIKYAPSQILNAKFLVANSKTRNCLEVKWLSEYFGVVVFISYKYR